MQRVLNDKRNGDQSHAFDPTNDGIPGRADATGEDLAPDKSKQRTLTPQRAKLTCCTHLMGPKLSALMVSRQAS